jgi:hypothetical protein
MTHVTVQQLSASLDGALTGPSLELVVRHLAACHECRDRQARLAKHDDALRRLLGQDPDDLFLDELTRRSEAQVIAISRGMPAPAMVTSVPQLHEEDPHAPVEPPPPPPRPELGRAGELAQEAGWGRIGMKPTAGTHAPESNPEEAQRLLEALESGNVDDFTELTAQGLQEHAPLDGPVFDLPAWIKDQSKSPAPKRDGPREVPKLNLFFADLDERAAGLTREAVDEVFRREGESDAAADAPATPATPAGPAHGLSLVPPMQPGPAVPPEHVAFAPPGWTPASPMVNAPLAAADRPAPEPSGVPRATQISPNAWDLGGFKLPAGAAPEPPRPPIPVLTEPFVVSIGPVRPARRSHARGTDRALVMALVSVGGLLFILVALQLAPAPGEHRNASATTAGSQPTRIMLAPRDAAPQEPPARNESRVVSASTAAPTDQAVSPEPAASPASDAQDAGTPGSESAPTAMPPVIAPESANDKATQAAKPQKTAARPAVHATRPTEDRTAANRTATAAATDDAPWPLLCGVVLDGSGQPLAGARILVTEIAFAVRSDARGRFCLSAPAGTQHLLIEADGFADSRQAVTLSANTPDVRVQMQHAN